MVSFILCESPVFIFRVCSPDILWDERRGEIFCQKIFFCKLSINMVFLILLFILRRVCSPDILWDERRRELGGYQRRRNYNQRHQQRSKHTQQVFFRFLKNGFLSFLYFWFPILYLPRNRWQQLTLVMPLKEISFQLLRLFTKSNSNLSARSDRSFTRIYKGFTISLNWIASSLKGKYVILKFLLSLFQCVFPFLLANSFVFVFVYIVYLKTAAAQFFSVKRKPMSTPNSPTRDRKVPHDYFYDETSN